MGDRQEIWRSLPRTFGREFAAITGSRLWSVAASARTDFPNGLAAASGISTVSPFPKQHQVGRKIAAVLQRYHHKSSRRRFSPVDQSIYFAASERLLRIIVRIEALLLQDSERTREGADGWVYATLFAVLFQPVLYRPMIRRAISMGPRLRTLDRWGSANQSIRVARADGVKHRIVGGADRAPQPNLPWPATPGGALIDFGEDPGGVYKMLPVQSDSSNQGAPRLLSRSHS